MRTHDVSATTSDPTTPSSAPDTVAPVDQDTHGAQDARDGECSPWSKHRASGKVVGMTHRADGSAPTTAGPTFRAGAATATGHRRRSNEDAYLAGPEFYLVADGMGGHRAGEIASRLAVETFLHHPAGAVPNGVDDIVELVELAHRTIVHHGTDPSCSGMGTTIVGASAVERRGRSAVAVFHVGDSRCYRLVDGVLDLVTRDHTHVRELIDAGRLDPAEAARHPLRNIVTRALGVELDDGPDVTVLDPPVGRLLLCSDGLWAELSPRTMGRVLSAICDPQAAADRLVELSLAGPARDNITAVVIDVDGGPDRGVPGR